MRLRAVRAWIAFALAVVPVAVCVVDPPSVRAQGTDGTTKTMGTDLKTTPDPTTKPTTPGTDLTIGTGTTLETTPPPHWHPPPPHHSTSTSTSTSESEATSAPPIASIAPPKPKAFVRRELPVGVGDITVTVGIPGDWPALDDEQLPAVDTTSMPDATIVDRAGYGWNDHGKAKPHVQEVVVVCGKGVADHWGNAIRDAAFVAMVDGVENELKKFSDIRSIEPPAPHQEGDRIVQPFSAKGRFQVGTPDVTADPSKPDVSVQGLSFLGFHAESGSTTVVGCTITCAETVFPNDADTCSKIAQTIEISGTFAPAPKPSWLSDLLFSLRKDKTTLWLIVIGALFFVALVVVVVVMMRRRKNAPATTTRDDHASVSRELEAADQYSAGYEAGLAAARAAVDPERARGDGAATSASATGSPPMGVGTATATARPGDAFAARSSSSSVEGAQLDSLVAPSPPVGGYIDPVSLARR